MTESSSESKERNEKLGFELVSKPFLQVLRELREGRLRVPRFQRPFVWRQEQMLDLLESVYLHYPIGSLLVWRATGTAVTSNDRIGPCVVPQNRDGQVGYLLDGHQRLTTLMVAFGALPSEIDALRLAKAKDEDFRWFLAYDLRDKTFLHIRRPKHVWQIPTVAFTRASDFYQHSRAIIESGESDVDQLLAQSQEVQDRLRDYQVTLIQLQEASLPDAVRVFGRLNSTGTPLTPEQVFSALSYQEGSFNLARAIDDILVDLEALQFQELKRTTVLRMLLAALDVDIYTTDFERVIRDHGATIEVRVADVQKALARAVTYLRTEFGVRSVRWLPYGWQVVFLCEFFRRLGPDEPDSRQKTILDRWFWVTSTTRTYAGGGSLMAADLIRNARSVAAGQAIPEDSGGESLRPTPVHFHQRAARVRATLLMLAGLHPKDLETGKSLDDDFAGGLDDWVVWPGANWKMIGSRLLVGATRGRKMRRSGFTLPPFAKHKQAWESHLVDEHGWRLLYDGKLEEFSEHRLTLVTASERKFLLDHTGRAVAVEPEPEAEEDAE